MNTEDQLTLFAGGSHVSQPPTPGSDAARTMTAGSGLRCFESYGRFVPDGSLLRTLSASLLSTTAWSSTAVYLTWKAKVTQFNRLIFQLAESEPRIEGTDSGLLPTVRPCTGKRSSGANRTELYRAMMQVGLLPTPNVPNGGRSIKHVDTFNGKAAYHKGKKVQITLESLARVGLLPAPRASDGAGLISTPDANCWKDGAPDQGRRQLNGRLNPRFVEQMMGFPAGWTDLEA